MGRKSQAKKNRKRMSKVAQKGKLAFICEHKVLLSMIAIFAVAMALRVATCYHYTYIQEGIIFFRGNDPWYHMRLSENMLANFPHMMTYDPYTNYPYGTGVITPPLWSWLSVAFSYIANPHPTWATLANVMCWMPPVFGSLCVIPTFFIGRAIHSDKAGLLAAAMVAILPTQLLTRSQLGFADHHILEILMIATMVMLLVWAYQRKKLWLYAVAGIPLGGYFLTWHGATFMMLPVGLWFVVQFIVDKKRGQLDNTLWQGSLAMTIVAFLMWFPYKQFSANVTLSMLTFIFMMGMVTAMGLLGQFVKKHFWYIFGGAVAVLAVGVLVVQPEYFNIVRNMLAHIFPTFAGVRTIAETKMTPLPYYIVVYGINPVLFWLALYWTIKRRWNILLVQVWGVLMFIAMANQQRWGYYLTVPLAILTAMSFWEIHKYFIVQLKRNLSVFIMVALVLIPGVGTYRLATSPSLMTPDWWNALIWLRFETPLAFETDPYLELDSRAVADYGIMSWWDYGHWITEVGHRVPYANPFQNQVYESANFFINGVEPEGNMKYVIIDNDMIGGKFYALRAWLGLPLECTQQEYENTLVVQMWNEAYSGYTLVYANESVKIFEKEGV